ncbi:MAG TPA: DUF309 domain-containing protein [Candidatus Binataceae bacterium]
MSPREYFELGIDLFNDGKFFECHEAWEEIWKRSVGGDKLFYQGLIQAAVAILHVERGNREGAAAVYSRARARLDPVADHHLGLEIGEFRRSLADFFATALSAGGSTPHRPKLHRAFRKTAP